MQKLAISMVVCALPLLFSNGAGLAAGKGERSKKISRSDANFMREAAEANMMETRLGKIAQDKALNDKVENFGERMVKDHREANEELRKLAAKKGVDLPNKLNGKPKSTFDHLSNLSGHKFDREYMETMVKDHKEDVEKFQREAKKADDLDVKKYASEYAPVLKKHLELARSAAKAVGLSASGLPYTREARGQKNK